MPDPASIDFACNERYSRVILETSSSSRTRPFSTSPPYVKSSVRTTPSTGLTTLVSPPGASRPGTTMVEWSRCGSMVVVASAASPPAAGVGSGSAEVVMARSGAQTKYPAARIITRDTTTAVTRETRAPRRAAVNCSFLSSTVRYAVWSSAYCASTLLASAASASRSSSASVTSENTATMPIRLVEAPSPACSEDVTTVSRRRRVPARISMPCRPSTAFSDTVSSKVWVSWSRPSSSRNVSAKRRSVAPPAGIPRMREAASLNVLIRPSKSSAITPSSMLSRMIEWMEARGLVIVRVRRPSSGCRGLESIGSCGYPDRFLWIPRRSSESMDR